MSAQAFQENLSLLKKDENYRHLLLKDLPPK